MPNLLTILPFLLCPLLMGGAMWFLMRASRGSTPGAGPAPVEPAVTRPLAPAPPPARPGLTIGGICLNWRVLAGLALVAGGVWVVVPNLIGAVLPLLLVAACPLSMFFMMRAMPGHQNTPPQPARSLLSSGSTPEGQLAQLKTALARTQAEQETLAHQIARLETAAVPAAAGGEMVTHPTDEPGQRPMPGSATSGI